VIASTQAFVLNKKNYGDTSLICSLFSSDYGKFSIIAKGARSIKNPLSAILQPLNHIECVYYYKSSRNIQILKEATIVDKYFGLEKNYTKMKYAFTIADMVNHISYVEYPSKIIYRLTKKIFESINTSKEKHIDILFIFFQLQCLIYLGYQPSIYYCSQCNAKLKTAVFNFSIGQLSCEKCCNYKLKLDFESIKIIDYLINTHLTKIISEFKFSYQKFEIINHFLYNYILYHLPDIKRSKALAMKNNYE